MIAIGISVAADVLSEDCILKWYKEAHSPKGKTVLLEQMKKMVEWLQNASEGKRRGGPRVEPEGKRRCTHAQKGGASVGQLINN